MHQGCDACLDFALWIKFQNDTILGQQLMYKNDPLNTLDNKISTQIVRTFLHLSQVCLSLIAQHALCDLSMMGM